MGNVPALKPGEVLGMPQSKLSNLLRGQFRGIGEARMLDCLNRLGRDVEIAVKKATRASLDSRVRGNDEGTPPHHAP